MLDETTTGHALQRLRELSGMSERRAARAIGVPRKELRAWEQHTLTPDADEISRAVNVYGHDLRDVIATRRPLTDPERPGVLLVGDEEIVVAEHLEPAVSPHDANIAVLRSYLAAVRRQRRVADGDVVELRADDLSSLAIELDLADEQLQGLLARLLDLTPAGAQYTTRALLVGALVAVIASGAVGSSWLAPSASAAAPPIAPDPVVAEHVLIEDGASGVDLDDQIEVEVEIGDAVTQEPQTFDAGNLGPTVRGPAFAPEHPVEAPPMPYAEVTPADVPHVMFSVEPGGATSVERGVADGVDDDVVDAVEVIDPAGSEDGSGVFSVTPRADGGGSVGDDTSAERTVARSRSLPSPGSPELPPGA